MIELDERDVRQVARSRLFRGWKKYVIGIPLGSMGVIFIVATFVIRDYRSNDWVLPALTAVVVGSIIGLILYSRKEKRAEETLIKEWKKES